MVLWTGQKQAGHQWTFEKKNAPDRNQECQLWIARFRNILNYKNGCYEAESRANNERKIGGNN